MVGVVRRPVVSGQWSVVSGQWSVVLPQRGSIPKPKVAALGYLGINANHEFQPQRGCARRMDDATVFPTRRWMNHAILAITLTNDHYKVL